MTCFLMRNHAPASDRGLATTDAFKNLHPLLHQVVALDIDEIHGRSAVLRYQDRFPALLDIVDEFGRLSLKGGYKFDSHHVTLE